MKPFKEFINEAIGPGLSDPKTKKAIQILKDGGYYESFTGSKFKSGERGRNQKWYRLFDKNGNQVKMDAAVFSRLIDYLEDYVLSNEGTGKPNKWTLQKR